MNWDEAHLLGDLEAQEARMSDDLVKRFDRRGTRTEYNLLSALDRNPTTINAGADICAEAKSTILAQADRIEELELEVETWKSRALHQNEVAGRLEAKLAQQDDLWAAFKHWEGERKFALRQIVKYLREGQDGDDTRGEGEEGSGPTT